MKPSSTRSRWTRHPKVLNLILCRCRLWSRVHPGLVLGLFPNFWRCHSMSSRNDFKYQDSRFHTRHRRHRHQHLRPHPPATTLRLRSPTLQHPPHPHHHHHRNLLTTHPSWLIIIRSPVVNPRLKPWPLSLLWVRSRQLVSPRLVVVWHRLASRRCQLHRRAKRQLQVALFLMALLHPPLIRFVFPSIYTWVKSAVLISRYLVDDLSLVCGIVHEEFMRMKGSRVYSKAVYHRFSRPDQTRRLFIWFMNIPYGGWTKIWTVPITAARIFLTVTHITQQFNAHQPKRRTINSSHNRVDYHPYHHHLQPHQIRPFPSTFFHLALV